MWLSASVTMQSRPKHRRWRSDNVRFYALKSDLPRDAGQTRRLDLTHNLMHARGIERTEPTGLHMTTPTPSLIIELRQIADAPKDQWRSLPPGAFYSQAL